MVWRLLLCLPPFIIITIMIISKKILHLKTIYDIFNYTNLYFLVKVLYNFFMVGGKVVKKLINQILKFGVVGGIAFVIDYGLMVFLTEVFKVPALI